MTMCICHCHNEMLFCQLNIITVEIEAIVNLINDVAKNLILAYIISVLYGTNCISII